MLQDTSQTPARIIRRMHLLIPFASALSDAAGEVMRDISLPTLATLLRIHVELQGCERVGAERALNLAEELAHNDLAGRDPDAPLPPGPRTGSSRQSSGWRTHVRSLSSWLQSG